MRKLPMSGRTPYSTSSISLRQVAHPVTHVRGSKFGTDRTCAYMPEVARKSDSDYAAAPESAVCAATSQSLTLLPSSFLSLDPVTESELPCNSHASLLLKRHAQKREQLSPLLICACRRHNADLHAPQLINLIIVDLRKNQLLTQP